MKSTQRFVFSVLGVMLLLGYTQSLLAGDVKDSTQDGLSYKLVMSENDALCKPLTSVFNNFLERLIERIKNPKDRHHENLDYDENYDFVVGNVSAFEAIGLKAPKLILSAEEITGHPGYGGVYEGDVYNNGETKKFIVYDEYTWPGNFDSQAKILPDDANAKEVLELATNRKKFAFEASASLGDYPTQKYVKEYNAYGYILEKWPNLMSVLRSYALHEKGSFIPGVDNEMFKIRPFVFQNKIYFVANEHLYPPEDSEGSTVVVYSMTLKGPDDVCYLRIQK